MKTPTLSEKKQPLFSDYCQFLLASFHNFTQTYFADHTNRWSHDQLNRLLGEERIPSRALWQSVKNDIEFDPDGYLLFDDMVVSKPYAKAIEPVRRQWSGSEKRVVEGIGIVACVYVNPKTQAHWTIDYRLYDVDRDGKPTPASFGDVAECPLRQTSAFSDGAHSCVVCFNGCHASDRVTF